MQSVYILYSKKLNKYYTGCTSDFETRLQFHKDADTHKFTYNADDWKVFLTIACLSKMQALAVEKHIKQMKSKKYIENLVKYPEMKVKLLEKYIDR